MFAAQNDQENRIHGQQTAAAAKPLNRGLKGFGAKTPVNKASKTPFKIALNDENLVGKGGKSVLKPNGKGNENLLLRTGKKGGELGKYAFITPAGPRNRAPLGMKTTNAKGTAFQTPAPLTLDAKTGNKTQQKSRSPRLRRAKVKVLQAEEEAPLGDDDDLEIEYMPPKEKPLPDTHDDFPPDLNLSMFEGRNFTRGMYDHYMYEIDEHGVSKQQREQEKDYDKGMKETDELLARACEATFAEIDESMNDLRIELGMEPILSPAKKDTQLDKLKSTTKAASKAKLAPAPSKAPSTHLSKSAASALSQPTRSTEPSFAAPTASTKARAPASLMSSKKPTAATSRPTTSHSITTAASKSTLGYAQGRTVSSALRKPSSSTRPASSVHSRTSSQATITPARLQRGDQNAETQRARPFSYVQDCGTYEDEDEIAEIEARMRGGLSPDQLLLGDEAFEEFRFEVPEL